MSAIAPITVKASNGSTDVVYVDMQPSSGDGTAAIWQVTAGSTAQAHRPEFRLSAKDADQGRKRAHRATYMRPELVTNTTTGVTSVKDRIMISASWTTPKEMSQASVDEAVAQFANILASTLVKSCIASGYSAT